MRAPRALKDLERAGDGRSCWPYTPFERSPSLESSESMVGSVGPQGRCSSAATALRRLRGGAAASSDGAEPIAVGSNADHRTPALGLRLPRSCDGAAICSPAMASPWRGSRARRTAPVTARMSGATADALCRRFACIRPSGVKCRDEREAGYRRLRRLEVDRWGTRVYDPGWSGTPAATDASSRFGAGGSGSSCVMLPSAGRCDGSTGTAHGSGCRTAQRA